MLPMRLFRSKQFSAANLVTIVVYGALGGIFFLLPVELQQGAGFSAIAAGAALLPVTAMLLLLSSRMGRYAARRGPRLQMTVGPIVAAIGITLLARVHPGSSYASSVLPGILVFGLGMATTVAPLTATVMAAAPSRDVGVASAVNNDVARTAALFAVAVLPALSGYHGDRIQVTDRAFQRVPSRGLDCCLADRTRRRARRTADPQRRTQDWDATGRGSTSSQGARSVITLALDQPRAHQ